MTTVKECVEHRIEFHCPGTLVDEVVSRVVHEDFFTVNYAVGLAADTFARYQSRPYGFHMVIRTWKETVVDGETFRSEEKTDRSGCYYIDGEVLTLDDIPDTKENEILRSNMRGNDIPAVVRTQNSWQHTGELRPKDIVLRGTEVVARGADYYKEE